jgi:non-ribosomal peptide synthetase-like protein
MAALDFGSQTTSMDTLAPVPRTLIDLFRATATEHPRRLALDAPDGAFTYKRLESQASKLAFRLARAGIGPGDRVGIRIPSGTAELYVAILGVLLAGSAYVPVDADDPDERAQWIWRASAVAAVVGPGLTIDAFRPTTRSECRTLKPGDDAWVIFTSGSTGTSKGVAISHASAAAFVDAEERLLKVYPTDRVLASLSVGFDASCEEMWLAWRNGAALVPVPRAIVRSGAELGPWIGSRMVSVVSTVPTLAGMWDIDDLDTVRLLILGGEACPDEQGWRLASEREVWNTYGPTETTVVATAAPIVPGVPISIGYPLDGWKVAVVDDEGRLVPDGCIGELVIGGVGLGRYLDPQLDNERFAPFESLGWPRAYRTGDLVRESYNGLEFVGRRDDQVKIGGRRIELAEIQAELRNVPGVRTAAVVLQHTEAGDPVLVGYVVTDLDAKAVRAHLSRRLPADLLPIVVPLPSLPASATGKLDRRLLPWPPPSDADDDADADADAHAPALSETERWLTELWRKYLGVTPQRPEDNFFDLGGSSLAAAKLASDLRSRFPSAGVADIYNHRTIGELAVRLERLNPAVSSGAPLPTRDARGGTLHIGGLAVLLILSAPTWIVAEFLYNRWSSASGELPQLGWVWLLAIWLIFVSVPGRILLVALARRVLLFDLAPGRYQRHSSLGIRVWFVTRLAELLHADQHGGTPWAPTVARLTGTHVGPGARLGVIPQASSLVTVGAGATLEADADVHGWWHDGSELVVGTVDIGPGARIGTRALLMPGVSIGQGAEVEPGSVVTEDVPPGERWAGSPARYVGPAGEHWPDDAAPPVENQAFWRVAYAVGMTVTSLLPLASSVPGLLLLSAMGVALTRAHSAGASLLIGAPLLAITFTLTYSISVALLARIIGRSIRPGWHSDAHTMWSVWMREELLNGTRTALFPLYSSIYTRSWLRLMGQRVGRRCEVSTAVGLSPLVSLGETSFVADDVVFNSGRSRGGWLLLSPIAVDSGVFLGNGAVIDGPAHFGDRSLLGVQSTARGDCPPDTTWFGSPPLEFPRVPAATDAERTVAPPASLIMVRAVVDLVRIVVPQAASMAIGISVFVILDYLGQRFGAWSIIGASPLLLLAAGLTAVFLTVAAKWALMGRYRAGDHPLWSWFVWRDEIVNTCQELLAGAWLLDLALGTPAMKPYLTLMGTKVGRDVWCDTLTITEFDTVTLGDGCALNRRCCIETHLFHDRVMSIGPIHIGAKATVGPSSAVLPDASLGEGCSVAGRSVVLRGESLPAHTRWHGAPVEAF